MKRAEVWWADLEPPAGRRPVVLLSRDEAYAVRELVTVAPVSSRIRGLPVEVPLGSAEGMPKPCVVNLDTITTIAKRRLRAPITYLPREKREALDEAIRIALGLNDPPERKLGSGPHAA